MIDACRPTPPVALPNVPDFDLVRPIGQGGFGQVWLAVNRTTGQPRAVKLIPRARVGSRDPAGREIASLVRLEANRHCRHPNLLTIQHVGETAEHLFYVMDLADDLANPSGTPPSLNAEDGSTKRPPAQTFDPSAVEAYRPATLENRLAIGPLSAADAERFAMELLAGLACLHEAAMVHRDVKPANCLLLGGELKLGDFGLLTAAGLAVSRLGTVRYMPPDGCMDARADVYAAGLVIYEMLTGLPVERFPSLGNRSAAIVGDCRLARLNRLALRACDPTADRRFCNAREMLDALNSEDERSHVSSRRTGWLAVAAGAALAAVLAFFGLREPASVGVNFVTEPYEATIYLDGQLLSAPDGTAYRTPCTIQGLAPGPHHVEFQWDEGSGLVEPPGNQGRADAGVVDFGENRQIVARATAE